MDGTPEPELTASPQINELIRVTHRYVDGHADGAGLRAAVTGTERFLKQMQALYAQQIRYREKTPLFQQQAPLITKRFQDALAGVARMKDFFQSQDVARLTSGLDGVRQGFAGLAACLQALQREEEQQEKFSRSPYMNGLLRLAVGARAHRLAPDALRDALAEMVAHHRRFVAAIDHLPRSGKESALYRERRPIIRELLGKIEAGLLDAQTCLGRGDVVMAEVALRRANDPTERLVDLQQEFDRIEEAAHTRPCLRCGAPNDVNARACGKCGAKLLPMPIGDDAGAVDVRLEDQIRSAGHVHTELTQRLANAARDAQLRRADPESMRRLFDETGMKVEQARRELGALNPPGSLPDEERAALQQARDALESGIAQMQEGLDRMRMWLDDGSPTHLETGIETFLSGADRLYAVQSTAEALKKQAGR